MDNTLTLYQTLAIVVVVFQFLLISLLLTTLLLLWMKVCDLKQTLVSISLRMRLHDQSLTRSDTENWRINLHEDDPLLLHEVDREDVVPPKVPAVERESNRWKNGGTYQSFNFA